MIPRLAAAGTRRHQVIPKSLLLLVFLVFYLALSGIT
jgi:hypothetical protein